MDQSDAATITLGALAAGGIGVGVWLWLRSDQRTSEHYPILERIRGIVNTPVTRERLEAWLNTRGEIRAVALKPPNARRIPVVGRTWVPMVARAERTNLGVGAANRRLYLNGIRSVLASAGRGDEDPRCVMSLMANESGWDTAGWCCNYGNVKSQGQVYADRTTLLDVPVEQAFVWTSSQTANGVFLLTDRYNSFDGYLSYPDPATYMRYHGSLLSRRYPEVIQGYRTGGLDGLLRAEEFIARRGYAERPYDPDRANERDSMGRRIRLSMEDYVFARQTRARGFWANSLRMLGETGWVR